MKRRRRQRQTHRQGFTLVEILVVVVILGIAAAVIVPQLGTRADLKAAAGARMLMADLIYAQNRAISTQTRHYVVFDAASSPQTYRICTATSGGLPTVDIPHPITKASAYLVTFGAGAPSGATGITPGLEDIGLGSINIEGHTTICFDEMGVPSYYDPALTGNPKTVDLSVTGGSTMQVKCGTFTLTVSVEPYTGEIKVN